MAGINFINENEYSRPLKFKFQVNKIYNENCLSLASRMPDSFIDCVITSPPYYGLRNYNAEGQFGLEETPEKFVENLVTLFREIRRAMKDTGTLWLNLGDSYVGTGAKGDYKDPKHPEGRNAQSGTPKNNKVAGLKSKDLIGIPWMVAFALRADGWYLRQDIIWHKPNPMPESVTDRCTKAHEYIFLLSKSQRYFYDAEPIREPIKDNCDGSIRAIARTASGALGGENKHNIEERIYNEIKGANKRSVWSVTTKPFKEAHFATFPEDLIEPCVLAGCPKGGLIYDPFGGAGTTAKVAVKHGRNYILSEINPDYIQIAEKRIRDFEILEGTPDPTQAIPGQQINLF